MIEPAVAAWAASHADDTDIAELTSLLQQMEARGPSPKGYRDFAVLDSRFHAAVAATARYRIATEQLKHLHVHRHVFRCGARKL